MGATAARRIPAVLLVGAGAALMTKAGVILSTGWQPPLLLQAGQMLCALALLLLLVGFPRRRTRFVSVGAIVAGAALGAMVAATLLEQIPGAAVSRGDDFVFPYSALILAASIGIFFAMVAFGIAFRREWHPARPSTVPLAAGLMLRSRSQLWPGHLHGLRRQPMKMYSHSAQLSMVEKRAHTSCNCMASPQRPLPRSIGHAHHSIACNQT